MRLDKFLKVSRLIKRRTLAKEVCDQGRVWLNRNQAKASSIVQIGDTLEIRFGNKLVSAQINQIKETSKKDEAGKMYTIISEKPVNPEETK